MATNPIHGGGLPGPDPRATAQGTKADASQGNPRVNAADGQEERPVDVRPNPRASGEKVQISQEAKELHELDDLMSAARKAIEAAPDVREDRIREVKDRLKSGVYQTEGIRDELAHRLSSLLKDVGIDDAS